MIKELTLSQFSAVDALHESTDATKGSFQTLGAVVPRPLGMASRPPLYATLWDTPVDWSAAAVISAHSITNATQTAAFRVSNEGQVFIVFIEFLADGAGGWLTYGRGMFYAGESGTVAVPVTYTASGVTITKLVEGLARNYTWRGCKVGEVLMLGNGSDANRWYQVSVASLRTAGSASVPAAATLAVAAATAGTSGFTGQRNVYITAFDPGTNGYGYESGQSVLSASIIPVSQNIVVTVTQLAVARFTKLRIYLSFSGTDSNGAPVLKYYLVKEVNNANAAHTITSDIILGAELAYKDSKVPAACSMFLFVKNRLYMSGNLASPSKIWVSKTAVADELLPEGMDTAAFLNIPGDERLETKPRVTCLHSHRDNVVAHTLHSLTVISTDGTFSRSVRPAPTGAINQACVATVLNGKTLFLGNDFNLYDVDNIVNQVIGDTQVSVATATNSDAQGYIRDSIDVNANIRFNDYPHLVFDPVNSLLWMSCNQSTQQYSYVPDGNPRLWLWDGQTAQITGPFYAPTIQSGVFREPMEGKFQFLMGNGTLCVWTLAEDYQQNALATSAAFTYSAASADPAIKPVHAVFPDGFFDKTGLVGYAGSKVAKGHVITIGTHWLEFDAPGMRKSIYYLDLCFVRNSRCHLWVEFYVDHSATPIKRVIGQRYFSTTQELRIPVAISGFRLRVVIYIGVGENKPCALRGAPKLGYEVMGGVP